MRLGGGAVVSVPPCSGSKLSLRGLRLAAALLQLRPSKRLRSDETGINMTARSSGPGPAGEGLQVRISRLFASAASLREDLQPVW